MKILGISAHYHESAAALLIDGEIVAASAEERFTRVKHDPAFPTQAIDFCLSAANIKKNDLDYVVFYEKPFRKFERHLHSSRDFFPSSRAYFADAMKHALTSKLWIKATIQHALTIPPDNILFVPHHLSHAAAAYYTSPFDTTAFLTIDGIGEWTSMLTGTAKGSRLHPQYELRYPHSLGLLYAAVTAYLGFAVNDGEFSVMGLAAYGKPVHTDRIRKLYRQFSDGSIALNLEYFSFHTSATSMFTTAFARLFSGLKDADIAASLQACIEEIVCTIATQVQKRTKETSLVYGGGVSLNSTLNGKLLRSGIFTHLWIYPAAGDDGGAAGAALYIYHHVLGNKKQSQRIQMFLGFEAEKKEYDQTISNCKTYTRNSHKKSEKHPPVGSETFRTGSETRSGLETLSDTVIARCRLGNDVEFMSKIVDALMNQKILGLFEGRAEFGPRALGHRSILADPRSATMKDKVNTVIKYRETFRPFAGAILEEYANEYFRQADTLLSPFMLATFPATSIAKKSAPAVIHADGTCRIQTVSKDYPGLLRKIMEEFYKRTHTPILLNTSFNIKGEPIVNSPEDAMDTFHTSGLDMLVLGDVIVKK